jgi:hypothetical protein
MTEHDNTPTEVEHQPTLPTLELPDYHGRSPVGMRTALAGAGNRIARAHGIGDRVVLVIEAKVKKAGHEETDDGLVYVETHKVVDLFELDRDPGARLLSHLRSQYRQAKDAADGRVPIPELGDEGWTDANGVVLTAQELAERRGDPVALLGAQEATPAVVVYDNGERALWPDEYERDFPRPHAGDEHAGGTVVELLHHETGETLEDLRRVAAEIRDLEAEVAELTAEAEVDAVGPFDDDQADEVEPYAVDDEEPEYVEDEDGYADVVPFEKPDRPREAPALPGEEELAKRLPTSADFAFVDTTVPLLVGKLAEIVDVGHLRRLVEAERQGRGRGLVARKGALDALYSRLAELGEVTP